MQPRKYYLGFLISNAATMRAYAPLCKTFVLGNDRDVLLDLVEKGGIAKEVVVLSLSQVVPRWF